ncbi:hypothetical protein BGZ83_011405 [Gryganskiella cystojenkinii]|nr:hypothetical protein BGZ83_011405 [Gryganskiella cystojenkinii]
MPTATSASTVEAYAELKPPKSIVAASNDAPDPPAPSFEPKPRKPLLPQSALKPYGRSQFFKTNDPSVVKTNGPLALKTNDPPALKANDPSTDKTDDSPAVKTNDFPAVRINDPSTDNTNDSAAVKTNDPSVVRINDPLALKTNDSSAVKTNNPSVVKTSDPPADKTNDSPTVRISDPSTDKINDSPAVKTNDSPLALVKQEGTPARNDSQTFEPRQSAVSVRHSGPLRPREDPIAPLSKKESSATPRTDQEVEISPKKKLIKLVRNRALSDVPETGVGSTLDTTIANQKPSADISKIGSAPDTTNGSQKSSSVASQIESPSKDLGKTGSPAHHRITESRLRLETTRSPRDTRKLITLEKKETQEAAKVPTTSVTPVAPLIRVQQRSKTSAPIITKTEEMTNPVRKREMFDEFDAGGLQDQRPVTFKRSRRLVLEQPPSPFDEIKLEESVRSSTLKTPMMGDEVGSPPDEVEQVVFRHQRQLSGPLFPRVQQPPTIRNLEEAVKATAASLMTMTATIAERPLGGPKDNAAVTRKQPSLPASVASPDRVLFMRPNRKAFDFSEPFDLSAPLSYETSTSSSSITRISTSTRVGESNGDVGGDGTPTETRRVMNLPKRSKKP